MTQSEIYASRLYEMLGEDAPSEQRSSLADPDPLLENWFNGGVPAASSGVIVNERTALTFAAVMQAVRILSEGESTLPIKMYRRLSPRGREPVSVHPALRLLDLLPNNDMPANVFRETMDGHVLLWGNAYAEIEMSNSFVPVGLHILPPSRVRPMRDADGTIYYNVNQSGKADTRIEQNRMFHLRGLGWDGLVGYSVIHFARQSLGVGMGAEATAASFIGNGVRPSGHIEHPGKLSEQAYANLRNSVGELYGGPRNTGKHMVFEEGAKWVSSGMMNLDDAQFLETREFEVDEVARWFNVPPHKLNDLRRATNNNIEQASIDFYTFSLRPWHIRWTSEAMMKLLTPEEQNDLYFEHDPEAILRGDKESQVKAASLEIASSIRNIDEVREKFNLNDLPGGMGKHYFLPVNVQPLQVQSLIASNAAKGILPDAPKPTGGTDPADPKPDMGAAMRSLEPLITDAATRVIRREVDLIRKAARKPLFSEGLDKLYSEIGEYARCNFDPVLTTARAIGADLPKDFVDEYLQSAMQEVRSAISAGGNGHIEALLTNWDAEKPANVAKRLIKDKTHENQ